MIQEMRARALETPQFEAGVDYFKVILGRLGTELPGSRSWIERVTAAGLSQHEEALLLYIERKGWATVHEMRDDLHFDSDDIRDMARKLVGDGCLEAMGPDVYALCESKSGPRSGERSVEEGIIGILRCLGVASAQEIATALDRPVSSIRYYLKKMDGVVEPTAAPHSPQRRYRLKGVGVSGIQGSGTQSNSRVAL